MTNENHGSERPTLNVGGVLNRDETRPLQDHAAMLIGCAAEEKLAVQAIACRALLGETEKQP